MSDIKFKRTTDYQSLVWMDSQLFPSDYPLSEFENTVWWIGTLDGLPMCYCGIKEIDEEYAYLNRAGVLKEFQGMGLQRRMIRIREKYAKREGFKWVITSTVRENYVSSNNLIRCGFLLYGPEDEWMGDDAFYFRKGLTLKPG